jgi:hypothetical protein
VGVAFEWNDVFQAVVVGEDKGYETTMVPEYESDESEVDSEVDPEVESEGRRA